MNIFMIHPHDLYTAPWAIRIIKLAESLVREGHSVTLAYFPNMVRRKNGLFIRKHLPVGPTYIELRVRRWNLFYNVLQVCRLSKNADVIHVQKCFFDAAIPAIFAASINNKPLHYDWDDNEALIAKSWEKARFSFLFQKEIALYERMMPRFASTISVASSALQQLSLEYGASPERVFSAPVGADLKEFDSLKSMQCKVYPPTGTISQWILYVGQLEGANYASILIDAFAEIAQCRTNVGMLIVGGGFGQDKIEKQIADHRLQGRAFVTGYVPHEQIPAIMARADVAVACLEDTMNAKAKSPLKVVEYLAAGLAVVGSNVGEIPRMLLDCGVLVPPGDVGALRDAVMHLIDNPDKREELKKKARVRVETIYNWDNSAGTLISAYEMGVRLQKGCD